MTQDIYFAEERALAHRYLKNLLPETAESEITKGLAETDKQGLLAVIADVGRRIGAHFYRVDGKATELFAEASNVPLLELSETPRVFVRVGDETIRIVEGNSSRKITLDKLSDEERSFLVPSPRMTLSSLRGRKRVARVLSYLSTEKSLLRALLIYAIFVEGLSLAAPLTVQVLINTIGFGMMTQQLVVLSGLLLIGLAGAAALKVFQQILVEYLSRRFFARTVMDYSERLSIVNPGKMKQPVHRFFEVASVDKAFFILGLDLIALVLQLVAATILLSFYHPLLLGFTVTMAAASWLIVRAPFSAGLSRSIEESEAKYELAYFIESKRDDDVERLHLFNRWEEARRSGFRIALGQQIGLFSLQVFLSVALLFVGGILVIEGRLTLGQLVAAELIAGTALLSLSKLGKQLHKIYDLITSFEKLGGFVDLPLAVTESGFTPAPSVPSSLGDDEGGDRD